MRAATMDSHIKLVFVLGLCFVHGCLTKPTAGDLSEARGIGSAIWGWMTYPFSWWSSEPEAPAGAAGAAGGQLPSTTRGPYDNIEVGRRNVTVWCNEQTCTTMRCDKGGCHNMTCSIYDTDLMGECRVYNTIPTKPVEIKPTEPIAHTTKVEGVQSSSESPTSTANVQLVSQTTAIEHPLELEAAISSTVPAQNQSPTDDKSPESRPIPHNKVYFSN